MIEAIMDGLESGLQISEIHDPAGMRIDRAAHLNLDAERVPMQPRTLVPFRDMRQSMGSFDAEFAVEIQGSEQ
jgi:hypothetical protein